VGGTLSSPETDIRASRRKPPGTMQRAIIRYVRVSPQDGSAWSTRYHRKRECLRTWRSRYRRLRIQRNVPAPARSNALTPTMRRFAGSDTPDRTRPARPTGLPPLIAIVRRFCVEVSPRPDSTIVSTYSHPGRHVCFPIVSVSSVQRKSGLLWLIRKSGLLRPAPVDDCGSCGKRHYPVGQRFLAVSNRSDESVYGRAGATQGQERRHRLAVIDGQLALRHSGRLAQIASRLAIAQL
jgi:hypothetical protein